MKLKNMWKRFWTLDVHNHEGFTLVELIIVIAILAILSTGAIAGYSAYVTSANKTADKALVAEISNVLMLDQYANNNGTAGYVVVYSNGDAAIASDSVTQALVDAYGTNWPIALALKYSDWKHNNPMTTAFTQKYNPATVGSSSFMKNSTSELLAHVSDLTGAAIGYLEGNDNNYTLMLHSLFNNDADLMKETCDQFGIDIDTDSYGNTVFADDVSSEQLSNLLVLGAANQLASDNAADSLVAGLALQYAGYVAFANAKSDDEAIQNAFSTMSEELKKGDTSALDAFVNDPSVSDEWKNYSEGDNGQYLTDLEAFTCIMEAVDDMSSNLTSDDIADGGFFTSDKVNSYFDNYVSSAATVGNMSEQDMSKIKEALNKEGCILIVLTAEGDVVCSSADIVA